MLVNHPFADPQGAVQPQVLVEHVGQGQKGFSAMHIAVGPAIRFAVAPVAGKGFQQGSFVFAPEPRFEYRRRLVQQGSGARAPGHHRGAGGQGDKGMQVRGFAGVAILSVGSGEPTSVHAIAQGPGQSPEAVVDQRRAARQALDMGQGETVNHTRGGHCVSRGIVWALAKAVKACKTERYPGGLGEIQQRLALIVQPLLVGGGGQPAVAGPGEIGHGPPVRFL